MFDKTFFKFALGFAVIIALSVTTLYIADQINKSNQSEQAAVVR